MDPSWPRSHLSLSDTLRICEEDQATERETPRRTPLRVLAFRAHSDELDLVPYAEGMQYVAVSYTWPSSAPRLYNSNEETCICQNQQCWLSQHVSDFMYEAMKQAFSSRFNPTELQVFWVDHECINQHDDSEKAEQMAVMDSIYGDTALTAIMLEDVELSSDELSFLKAPRRREGFDRQLYLALCTRIMQSRWFTRAWCSQEALLARGAMFFVHRTGEPSNPVSFAHGALDSWLSRAMTYGSTLGRLPAPRGFDYTGIGTTPAAHPYAWAYGVVRNMGCLNGYDKISLAQNLVRAPRVRCKLRLSVTTHISVGKKNDPQSSNIAKLINVLAVQSGDFSLLQTGHMCDNMLPLSNGFSWAGLPIPGDSISAYWHPRYFEERNGDTLQFVDVPGSLFSNPRRVPSEDLRECKGIQVTGLADEVVTQQDWRVWREGSRLFVRVNLRTKEVPSDWFGPISHKSNDIGAKTNIDSGDWPITPRGNESLQNGASEAYEREEPLQKLRDILYALEAMNAEHLWPAFMPADDSWIRRRPNDGYRSFSHTPLRDRILAEYGRPSTPQRDMANGLAYLYREGKATFSVIDTAGGGGHLIVHGNVQDMKGKIIFQPYVMRLKEFSGNRVACNAFVLSDAQPGKPEDVRLCAGHVRSLHLLPEHARKATYILQ